MSLAPGAKLGPYEILAPLGAGGMGEVYRARDAKLNRDVALKVLPESFANDPDRLARFRREAQVLASLNHPNIAGIYGLEDTGAVKALVLELVEGPTLAERLAQGSGLKAQAGLPLDEVLPIARQITDALEAAHEQGIIHRDLKPANIKVRADGAVKVLDFGLAKIAEDVGRVLPSGPAGSKEQDPAYVLLQSPTITSPAMMTGVGVILGTAAYMSPEQARGKSVDKRADIWAFGCVLYEMMTGKRAFEGEEVSDTLAAILRGEPDWNALPASTPAPLRAVLTRCFEKDRKKRIADIADVRYEIDRTFDAPPAVQQTRAARLNLLRSPIGLVIAGVLIGALGAATLLRHFAIAATVPQTVRFSFALPDGWSVWTPSTVIGQSALVVSPNGSRIAFVARERSGKVLLWVRGLDKLDAVSLPGTENATSPFWSPDSRSIGFFADGKLKRAELSGGRPTTLCDAPDNRGGSWNQDGVIIFAPRTGVGLQKVSATGGSPTQLTTLAKGEPGHARPYFLPDGQHFLYRQVGGGGITRGIYVAALNSNERTHLMDSDTGDFFYSEGHLLFLRGSTLMAQPLEPRNWIFSGEAFPAAEGVSTFGNANFFAASPNGVLVYQAGTESLGSELVWLDRAGKRLGVLGSRGRYDDVELSPDGKRLAVSAADRRATSDIWLYDVTRGVPNRFTTTDAASEESPVWSADGSRLVYNSNRIGGKSLLFEKPVAADGTETAFGPTDLANRAFSRARDGSVVYQSAPNLGAPADLWLWPGAGGREPVRLTKTSFAESRAKLSPDERWISYTSDRSETNEIYVTSFPKPGEEIRVSDSGGTSARWRRDGRELFYISSTNALMAAEVDGRGVEFKVQAARRLFDISPSGQRYSYDVAADGQRFIVNLSPQVSDQQPITVVVDWLAGLKK